MNPEMAREQVQLYEALERQFLETLQYEDWAAIATLRETITEKQAMVACRICGDWLNWAWPAEDPSALGHYRHLLTRKLIEYLVRRGVCEMRNSNGIDRIRLARTTATRRSSDKKPKVRSKPCKAKSGSPHRASTKKKLNHDFGEFAEYFDLP